MNAEARRSSTASQSSSIDAGSKASYDEWHKGYDVDSTIDAPWNHLLLARIDPARDLRGKRVLEIACGRGGLALRLADMAGERMHFVAADFSLTAVAKGHALAHERRCRSISWHVGDAQLLSYSDKVFDTVISCETIEHLPSPRAALAEFHRVLKPGGRLFLTTPNYFGPIGLYRGYLRLTGRRFTEEDQPINRFLMLPQTVSWVRRIGLRVTSVDAVGHYLLWPGRKPYRLLEFDSWKPLRWLAHHSLIVGEKRPNGTSSP
jgi:ubiquinone/menaquinone biosynthesis C-methylase UbiE